MIIFMTPVYQQIVDEIIRRIEERAYKEGDKIPSEAQLMEEFETSRITVTRALKELEYRKLIYREQGKGSFVADARAERNRIISLVIPHTIDFFSGGEQYSRTIYQSCRDRGYLCSVHYSERSVERERQILRDISSHNVSGIILYPIGERNVDVISRLVLKQYPIVLLDRSLEELDLPSVQSDNLGGAYQAVDYCLQQGHRSIAFIGKKDSQTVVQRYKGYCRALMDHSVPLDGSIVFTRYSQCGEEDYQEIMGEDEALDILQRLKAERPDVSACFCVNDIVAYRLIQAAEKVGIRVPEDLSVVGFDNLHYLSRQQLQLSTVEQNFAEISRQAVELIVRQIEGGEDLSSKVIDTRLVPGGSVIKRGQGECPDTCT